MLGEQVSVVRIVEHPELTLSFRSNMSKHYAVLCDECLWGADNAPGDFSKPHVAHINKLYSRGHQITLVSRRLNQTGTTKMFIRDIAELGLEYTTLHDVTGFPAVDAVYPPRNLRAPKETT